MDGTDIYLELLVDEDETYYTISGIITSDGSSPVDGATVALVRGTQVLERTTSASDGSYSFSYVTAGTYNMVATKDDKTVTSAVVITNAAITNANATLSSNSSTLEVKDNVTSSMEVSKIVVVGLDKVATTTDQDTSVTLTVDATDDQADGASHIETLAEVAEVEYLAIDLTKDSDKSPITSINTVLEIIVPYDFSDKENVTVYRYHGTQAEKFTEADTKLDGTFRCDTTNNLLYIYTSKFSTYAVGYDVVSSTVTPDNTSSGGTYVAYYTSTVASTDNGTASISSTRSVYNNTITITTTPDDGYEVGSVVVTYGNGLSVTVTDKGDGTYSYKQPASSATVTVTYVAVDGTETEVEDEDTFLFVDVDSDDWFYDAMKWAVENGVTAGTSTTTFYPNGITTRAQAVTFLWRSLGCPESEFENPFTDVAEDSYYYEALLWAVENGITVGTSDTTFSPDMDCSRAHIITFLWRMMGEPVVNSINLFADVPNTEYYCNATLWAVGESITTGTTSTTFSPNNDCTRAQIVTFLYRTLAE